LGTGLSNMKREASHILGGTREKRIQNDHKNHNFLSPERQKKKSE